MKRGMLRIARGLVIVAAWICAGSALAAAEPLSMVRIAKEKALVLERPDPRSATLQELPADTVLEILDRQNGWYWVLLPRDENGTAAIGWVRSRDVEVVSNADPRHGLKALSEPEPPDPDAEREAAKTEARIERARQDLERARDEYDALNAEPGTPAVKRPKPQPAPMANTAFRAAVMGGPTFGTPAAFSAGFQGGMRLTPRAEALVEFGRLGDVASTTLEGQANANAVQLASITRSPIDVTASAPAWYGLFGGRFGLPWSPRTSMQTYVDAGLGFARLSPDVTFSRDGLAVNDSYAWTGLTNASVFEASSTHMLSSIGAGFVLPLNRMLSADVSYRLMHVAGGTQSSANVNRIGFGIGARF
jgi:hypothetical protein